MTPPGAAATPAGRGAALAAGLALAFLLPAAMAIANRSAPATLALSALLALAAVAGTGAWPALRAELAMIAGRPSTRLVALFAALALASLVWSVDRARSLRSVIELSPVIVAGLVAVAAAPVLTARHGARAALARAAALGIFVAAGLVLLELALTLPLRRLVGARLDTADLKRAATPLAILVWPAIALLAPSRRAVWGALLVAAAFAAALAAHSGTAMFGVLAGLAALGLARLAPRAAVATAGAGAVGALLLAPLIARKLEPGLALFAALERFHAHHRILIWDAFAQRVGQRPFLGHGFGAIDRVWAAPGPDGRPVDPAVAWVTENIHAHDQPLQIWVELGAAGALVAIAVAAAVLLRIERLPAAAQPTRLAAFAAIFAISLVGFGAWQAWWPATIAAALALFAADRATSQETGT